MKPVISIWVEFFTSTLSREPHSRRVVEAWDHLKIIPPEGTCAFRFYKVESGLREVLDGELRYTVSYETERFVQSPVYAYGRNRSTLRQVERLAPDDEILNRAKGHPLWEEFFYTVGRGGRWWPLLKDQIFVEAPWDGHS